MGSGKRAKGTKEAEPSKAGIAAEIAAETPTGIKTPRTADENPADDGSEKKDKAQGSAASEKIGSRNAKPIQIRARPIAGARLISSLDARARAEETGRIAPKIHNAPALLREALKMAQSIGKEGGVVLFVAGDGVGRKGVEEAARLCGMPWATGKWRRGQLSEFEQTRQGFEALEKIGEDLARRGIGRAEAMALGRRKEMLSRELAGLAMLETLPKAIFVAGARDCEAALLEAKAAGIESLVFSGEDSKWQLATRPIPGAAGSEAEIARVAREIAEAILAGKKEASAEARRMPIEAVRREAPSADGAIEG